MSDDKKHPISVSRLAAWEKGEALDSDGCRSVPVPDGADLRRAVAWLLKRADESEGTDPVSDQQT
jgi:hypothetical protein